MKPEFIIIHTAAHGTESNNKDTSAGQIDDWHKARGWRGIGYHEVVRLDGTIEHGRAHDRRGAHCTSMGMNSKSIGICFSGHGDYHHWTEAQEQAGVIVIASICSQLKIPVNRVLGHHETGARKTCPGKLIDMVRVRNLVAASLGDDDPGEGLIVHLGTGVDFTGMFRNICDIFDDPNYNNLPDEAKRMVKHLRLTEPFAHFNREDL